MKISFFAFFLFFPFLAQAQNIPEAKLSNAAKAVGAAPQVEVLSALAQGVVNQTGDLVFNPVTTTGSVVTTTATQTLTNKTLTSPTITGATSTGPAPVAVGASATAAGANGTYLLNTAAGSVLTLPAATGSGNKYRVIVTTTATSNAHKILAASSSDFINGIAYGFTGSTAKVFASAAATNHSIQMPFAGTQPSGGFIGDWFEITDVATNLWQVSGFYQAGTTPTTPFSAATS